jgi:hypothetical protein
MSRIEIDVKQLERLRKKFAGLDDKLFNQKALLSASIQQKQRIILRTENGKDVNGNPFKPYSAQYAKLAQKLNVNNVNLVATGQMLNGITQKATDQESVIFFTNDRNEEIASYHDVLGAGRNKVIRNFFGMSEKNKDTIFKDYLKGIRKDLEKEGFK